MPGTTESMHFLELDIYSLISPVSAGVIKVVQRPSFIDFVCSFSEV